MSNVKKQVSKKKSSASVSKKSVKKQGSKADNYEPSAVDLESKIDPVEKEPMVEESPVL